MVSNHNLRPPVHTQTLKVFKYVLQIHGNGHSTREDAPEECQAAYPLSS